MSLKALRDLANSVPTNEQKERLAKVRKTMEELNESIKKQIQNKKPSQALLNKTVNWVINMAKTLVRAKIITDAGTWLSSDWGRGFVANRLVKLNNDTITPNEFECLITDFAVGDMLVVWPNGMRTSYKTDSFDKNFTHVKDEYYQTDLILLFYPGNK